MLSLNLKVLSGANELLGDMMPSFFLFSFVVCLHFVAMSANGALGMYSFTFS